MNRPGDDFFAGTSLADNQNRSGMTCHLLSQAHHPLERVTADNMTAKFA
jgi:hypothetical protein